ncbi:GGDEF domain-containing protein [Paraburkholderia hospita]|uniref:diguanylate cyclase domain-containing protein n=1 Tax=Paraburkholderia hospita TaxID=169430 RepID=UPI000DEF9E4B
MVTISVGVAATQAGQDSDPALLIGAADRALYAPKRQGRNCICIADVDDQEPTESELRVERGESSFFRRLILANTPPIVESAKTARDIRSTSCHRPERPRLLTGLKPKCRARRR